MRLSDVGVFIRGVGYDPSSDLRARRSKNTVDLLRANNVQNARIVSDDLQFVHRRRVRADQYLQPGDILICAANGSKRLVGKSAQLVSPPAQPSTFGAFMMVYRPDPAVIVPGFAAQQFLTKAYRDWVDLLLAGSSINNLRPSDVGDFQFELPPLEEQQRITAVLADADASIDALQHRLDKAWDIKQGMVQRLLPDRTRSPIEEEVT